MYPVVASNQPFCSTAEGGGRNSGSINPVAVTAHQIANNANKVSRLIHRVLRLRRTGIAADALTGFTAAEETS
jgi:hypothetical protein